MDQSCRYTAYIGTAFRMQSKAETVSGSIPTMCLCSCPSFPEPSMTVNTCSSLRHHLIIVVPIPLCFSILQGNNIVISLWWTHTIYLKDYFKYIIIILDMYTVFLILYLCIIFLICVQCYSKEIFNSIFLWSILLFV